MTELQEFASTHTPPLRQAMEDIFAERRVAAAKLTPHLVESLDALAEFSLRGGKYIRPMLVLLACQLAGSEVHSDVYQAAAAVELFHKHILNIDDMADRDEVRYGGPTLWKKYTQRFKDWKETEHHARTFAELDGTLLGSFAFELVRRSGLSAEQRLAIMDVLNNQMYFETVAGWQIHYYQNHQSLAEATEAEFLKGLDLVTSRYTFVGPLQIGLIASGKQTPQITKTLHNFGLKVGMAFQLTDDVIGLFGDPKETGKAVGNDVREGKKTFLLQRAYRAANSEDQNFLIDVCGRDLLHGELERVQNIVRDTGAYDESQTLAQTYINEAIEVLETCSVADPLAIQAKQTLKELALSIVGRKK